MINLNKCNFISVKLLDISHYYCMILIFYHRQRHLSILSSGDGELRRYMQSESKEFGKATSKERIQNKIIKRHVIKSGKILPLNQGQIVLIPEPPNYQDYI